MVLQLSRFDQEIRKEIAGVLEKGPDSGGELIRLQLQKLIIYPPSNFQTHPLDFSLSSIRWMNAWTTVLRSFCGISYRLPHKCPSSRFSLPVGQSITLNPCSSKVPDMQGSPCTISKITLYKKILNATLATALRLFANDGPSGCGPRVN